jgi:hypothetical protein
MTIIAVAKNKAEATKRALESPRGDINFTGSTSSFFINKIYLI